MVCKELKNMSKSKEQLTEELIEHWMWIAQCVFVAEDKVQLSGWRKKLKDVKSKSPEEREKIARDYLRAIAVEIVTNSGE